MTRPASAATLPGSRWAVLALLTATAALAFDAGRNACPSQPAQSAHLTRTAR
jgi:hypothetical protein